MSSLQEEDSDCLYISRASIPTHSTSEIQEPPKLTPIAEFWHNGDVDKARAMPQYNPGGAYLAAVLSLGRGSVSIYDLRAAMHDGLRNGSAAADCSHKTTGSATASAAAAMAATAMDVDSADEDANEKGASARGGGGKEAGGSGGRPMGSRGPLLDIPVHDTTDGLGLAWSPAQAGLLLCSVNSGNIELNRLDCSGGSSSGSSGSGSVSLQPASSQTFLHGHGGQVVNDLAFNPSQPDVFASVGEDGGLAVWDVRRGGALGPISSCMPYLSSSSQSTVLSSSQAGASPPGGCGSSATAAGVPQSQGASTSEVGAQGCFVLPIMYSFGGQSGNAG